MSQNRISVTKTKTVIEYSTPSEQRKAEMVATMFKHMDIHEMTDMFTKAAETNKNLNKKVVFCVNR